MIPLSLAEVETVTRGRCQNVDDPSRLVTGPVVVDSRQVAPGSLFVAVVGEHLDGHDFADVAVDGGAVAVLATRPVDVPAVVVDDVVAALGQLARAVADRLPRTAVVGVTGSSGKTSTKDLLAHLLERLGPTIAPAGSFNNEIGLPLTVLRADETTRHLVLELGARGPGHVSYLCGIAPPRIGVVLNVGSAHLGEFGGREAVAKAKGELVEALPAGADGGLAVLNADDPLVAAMANRTAARIVTFGVKGEPGRGAQVRASGVSLDAGRAAFTLVTPEGSAPVRLRLYGAHHVPNALAAACVARELGMGVEAVAAALSEAEPRSRWRMEVTERADGVTVVNDAYNANPESMRAALDALVALAGGRRTWAVLGEMRELGAVAGDEHEALGRTAAGLGVSRLVVVGDGAARIHAGATRAGSWEAEPVLVPDTDAALAVLRRELRPGDVVLVKASRAAGLELVAEGLLARSEPPAGPEVSA